MQFFEIKPAYKRISFGDLADLKRVIDNPRGFKNHMLNRTFRPGNYTLSTVSDESVAKSNPVIIMHQENVNPRLLLQTLKEIDGKSADTASNSAAETVVGSPTLHNHGPNNDCKKNVLNPCDWFTKKAGEYPVGKAVEDGIYQKVYKAHEIDGAIIAERKAQNSPRLFYFINDLVWKSASIANVKISSAKPNVYKLEIDGKPVGIAFNPADMMNPGPKRGILFREPNSGIFAFIIQSLPDQPDIDERTKFSYPMETFLYETEYRCFFENGEGAENPFYGENGSNQFDYFSHLPSDIFVDILLRLPRKQRLLVRRVSTHWQKAANSALVISSKIIDTNEPQYKNMKQDELDHLLPIVADSLESLIFYHSDRFEPQLNIGFVSSITSFRSLRDLKIKNRKDLDSDQFFLLLDKCPNLESITAAVPVKLSGDLPRKAYESVKKLFIPLEPRGIKSFEDPYLMAIADHFPNLVEVCIAYCERVTARGASAFVERFGSNLKRLEFKSYEHNRTGIRGVFHGISACRNLTCLALIKSRWVSDSFLAALPNECKNLETLDLHRSHISNKGLAALAELPYLKKLDISQCGVVSPPWSRYQPPPRIDVNQGVITIVTKGRLEQFLARNLDLTSDTVKRCIRSCRGLLLLDIRYVHYSVDEIVDMINLWGSFGRAPRLVIRTRNQNWRSDRIGEIQLAIQNGGHSHCGRLVVDARRNEFAGFLKEDDNEINSNALVIVGEEYADHMSESYEWWGYCVTGTGDDVKVRKVRKN